MAKSGYFVEDVGADLGFCLLVGKAARFQYSDLGITAKELDEQIAGGVSIIGPVTNEAGHFPVNLIQKLGQGSRITHILSGQIRADDLACGEV